MDIDIKEIGIHKVVIVRGDVDLYSVSNFKKEILKLLEDEHIESLIVDMKDINYIDSSGIGALVTTQKKMRTRSGKFGLMNIRNEVMNILKLATLDQFFSIYENESQLPS